MCAYFICALQVLAHSCLRIRGLHIYSYMCIGYLHIPSSRSLSTQIVGIAYAIG